LGILLESNQKEIQEYGIRDNKNVGMSLEDVDFNISCWCYYYFRIYIYIYIGYGNFPYPEISSFIRKNILLYES